EFRRVAATVSAKPPRIPIVSNVTGALATAEQLASPDYWVRHVRQAVRFLDGVRTLEAERARVLLEIGPHGVLASMAAACLSDAEQQPIATQHRERPSHRTLIEALAELHG